MRKTQWLEYIKLFSEKSIHSIEDDASESENEFKSKSTKNLTEQEISMESLGPSRSKPTFFNLENEEQKDMKTSPKSPKSPKNPKSPKSPKTAGVKNRKTVVSFNTDKPERLLRREEFFELECISTINQTRKFMNLKDEEDNSYKKQNLFDMGFEKMKNYSGFFPAGNFANVLKKFLHYLKSREKKLKKGKRHSFKRNA